MTANSDVLGICTIGVSGSVGLLIALQLYHHLAAFLRLSNFY